MSLDNQMPTIAQIVFMLLGLTSTGLLGLLLFIATKAFGSIDDHSKTQTHILITISSMQQQIKSLFNGHKLNQGDIEKLVRRFEVLLTRR